MKLAIDIQPLQSQTSKTRGIGRYTLALLEALLERQSPIDYQFFGNTHLSQPELRMDELNCVWLDYPTTYRSPENTLFANINYMSAGCDGIFIPSPLEDSDTAIFDFEQYPGKLFTICYDLIPLLFQDRYLPDRSYRDGYIKRLGCVRRADIVFAISEATRQDVISHLGIPAHRVVTISSGVSPFFHPLQDHERDLWSESLSVKFQIDKPFVMYTGGEDWRKNLTGLVAAFGQLSKDLREAHQLVIACRLSETGIRDLKSAAAANNVEHLLVLTNYVSDDELRALYNLCALFVFPSRYEGFGLPVLEAMACGAAVIAGNNSSLAEIIANNDMLFDAATPEAVCAAMQRLLADPALRRQAARDALERAHGFSWDKVAEIVERCIQSALSQTSVENSARKRALAFFSPLKPLRSGISDYSEKLLEGLAGQFDIDIYHAMDTSPDPGIANGMFKRHIYGESRFSRRSIARDYEMILYQIGNSEYHISQYLHLMRYSGVADLHDYHLAGLVNLIPHRNPHSGITLLAELIHNYGEDRGSQIFRSLHDGSLKFSNLAEQGVHVNRRIFTRSLGVIVHSRWAYEEAVRDFGNECEFITYIPLLSPMPDTTNVAPSDVYRLLGIDQSSFIVSAFGVISSSKRILPILTAFAEYSKHCPLAHLVLVGKEEVIDFDNGVTLEYAISKYGLTGRVHVTGYVNKDTFNTFIRASDICLNLRYPYHGESSAALLELLSHGKPTIVTDIGAFSDFPDNAVLKIPIPQGQSEVDHIVEALVRLTEDTSYRAEVGRAAAEYVRREHSPERCINQYGRFIEQVFSAAGSRQKALADYAGRESAAFRPPATESLLRYYAGALAMQSYSVGAQTEKFSA